MNLFRLQHYTISGIGTENEKGRKKKKREEKEKEERRKMKGREEKDRKKRRGSFLFPTLSSSF